LASAQRTYPRHARFPRMALRPEVGPAEARLAGPTGRRAVWEARRAAPTIAYGIGPPTPMRGGGVNQARP